MKATRVFITGAAGFVGRYLTRALNERGASVFGYGLEPASPPQLAGWFRGDVCDVGALCEAVADAAPNAIVHLAGQASAARSFEAPQDTFRVNVVGAWSVLEAVRRSAPDARTLMVGSGESYGPQPEGSHVSEDAPFKPVSPYAMSKAAADALCESFASAHQLAVIRTRSFAHTGPGQPPTFVLPAFAQQVAAIERGELEPVLRVGNLEVTRDISDVRDVVESYVMLLEEGRPGAAYNVGTGRGVRLADVARDLVALAQRPIRIEVDASRFRPADVAYLVADVSRLHAEVGHRTRITLEQTLADVLAGFRASAHDLKGLP